MYYIKASSLSSLFWTVSFPASSSRFEFDGLAGITLGIGATLIGLFDLSDEEVFVPPSPASMIFMRIASMFVLSCFYSYSSDSLRSSSCLEARSYCLRRNASSRFMMPLMFY